MSKGFVRSAVTVCAVVAFFAALKLLPRVLEEEARRQALDDAVKQVVGNVAQQGIKEAARDLAHQAVRSVALERRDYTITLPVNSIVDPQDGEVDQDHLTTANLPNGVSLNLVVIEDKTRAAAVLDDTVAALRAQLDGPTVTPVAAAAGAARAATLRGHIKGVPFVFEIVQFDGRERSCTVISEYPESTAAAAATMLRGTLATLHMKV